MPAHRLKRRRVWAGFAALGLLALWVLSASRPASRVEGCPAACAAAEARRDGPLRVLSLNVLHGFPRFEHLARRLDLVAAEIHRLDADVVLLQEVPWIPGLGSGAAYLARRTGLNYVYARANGNRHAILFEEGEAILSRFPLHNPTFSELEPRAWFFEHRVALRATVVTPWGDLPVVVTHLTHRAPETNRAQAASLLAFVDAAGGGPTLVAGDFNARENSPQIERLAAHWIDAYRAARPDDPGFTCCAGDLAAGPDESLEKRIDYVFLAPGQGLHLIGAQRVLDQPFAVDGGWQWASDHAGLLVLVEMGR